jgi:hypothetical protein
VEQVPQTAFSLAKSMLWHVPVALHDFQISHNSAPDRGNWRIRAQTERSLERADTASRSIFFVDVAHRTRIPLGRPKKERTRCCVASSRSGRDAIVTIHAGAPGVAYPP